MKGFWLFLFGALCGIAGTGWSLHRSSLPDVFAALQGAAPDATQIVEEAALSPRLNPVAVAEPPAAEEIVEPNCEPVAPSATLAIPASSTAAPDDPPAARVAATGQPLTVDAAPEPDQAVAPEASPGPTAEQVASPSVELATAAPVATAPETPAEKAVGPDPVATEPVPPPAATPEESAVPTPIADSYQAHADALTVPVTGITPAQLSDTFDDERGSERRHEAMDIMAPKGTPVVAVDDGKVVKLFNSVRGGLTVYQFDPGEKLAYYYAHLDSYAPGVVEGKVLKRGDLIGIVGVTGNSNPDAPHLHFAVFELDPEKRWWKGTAINPYPLFKR